MSCPLILIISINYILIIITCHPTLPVPGFQCGLPLLRRSGSDCSDRPGRHSSGAGVLGPGWRCEGVGTEGKRGEEKGLGKMCGIMGKTSNFFGRDGWKMGAGVTWTSENIGNHEKRCISLKLSKLAEMGNESTRLHVETWDQTHGKLVNKKTCFHMVNMSYWLIYNNLTMWGPPVILVGLDSPQ